MELGAAQKKFLLLQINDALFPIGGYSHSFGLETYIQKGLVKDDSTAFDYISKRILLGMAYTELLAIRLAYDAAAQHDFEGLARVENILRASAIPFEVREAVWKLGSRFVKTLVYTGTVNEGSVMSRYLEKAKGMPTSHCCAYGIFCCDIGIPAEEALTHYLYAQASSMVTNCVKSVPLSQSAGQKVLASLHPVFTEALNIAGSAGEDMFCMSAPGFDIRSIQHETLYSRIYMS